MVVRTMPMKRWNNKSKLETEQQEKLILLGQHLQQIRIEKAIPISLLVEKTKIQGRLIVAIETGDLEILPEPIYIRELIKQIANCLGENGKDLAQKFPISIGANYNNRYISWLRFGFQKPTFQLKPIHLYILYILVVMFSVKSLSNLLEPSTLNTTNTYAIEKKSFYSPAFDDGSGFSRIDSDNKQVVVDIIIKDQSWLQVEVDGKVEFEGTLASGSHRTWMANNRLTIKAANAGGVLVAFNHRQAKQLGKPGELEEVTFRAKEES